MFNRFITKPTDLVTTHEQTRAGFLRIALEKNIVGNKYVENALAFKAMVQGTKSPDDFLRVPDVRHFMLAASGLSEKSRHYLSDAEQDLAIKELIEKFLKPAGNNYIDEAIYRYLLIKGDAVGGTMRNRIGALGQEKLVRSILSCMNVRGIEYMWMANDSGFLWKNSTAYESHIEKSIKAIHWKNKNNSRILAFNMTIPTIRKNVDICLFDGDIQEYDHGRIVRSPDKAIMLGELKGGIDPAGADEHWKTANTSLERIRNSFATVRCSVLTSFVGAAIVNAMAEEIFTQLQKGIIDNAANLTDNNQLTEYCNWILDS